MSGFRFAETMRGSYHMLDAPTEERAMEFSIKARVGALRKFRKDKIATIEGHVTMEGFADAPLRGTLGMLLFAERRLPYDFSFVANNGRKYRFTGEKEITALALAESITVLPASLYDDAENEVGRALVRFDLRGDLRSFVQSFRPVLFG